MKLLFVLTISTVQSAFILIVRKMNRLNQTVIFFCFFNLLSEFTKLILRFVLFILFCEPYTQLSVVPHEPSCFIACSVAELAERYVTEREAMSKTVA